MEAPDSPSAAARHASRLGAAIAIGLGILAAELAGGLLGNSLALLADAGHVFADVSGMALSYLAIRIARRPRTDERTFGLYRLEILAATANGVLLLVIVAVVAIEGVRRLASPPAIQPDLVMAVAAGALIANLVAARLLAGGRRESLNIRGAYLEVLGDLLGSAAVLAAGVVVALTGWHQADAVASLVVAALIVPRTGLLLRDGVDVLLEATPRGVDLDEVRRHILGAPGVTDVHDLHAWTITSGLNVVSAHVVLAPDARSGDVLDHLCVCLSDDFDVDHSTFQLETPEHMAWEDRASRPRH